MQGGGERQHVWKVEGALFCGYMREAGKRNTSRALWIFVCSRSSAEWKEYRLRWLEIGKCWDEREERMGCVGRGSGAGVTVSKAG